MSKSQTLKNLVMERLVVAADEIFALFERTIAEYEEEALLSKLETHNNTGIQTLNPDVGHEHIKEEQTVMLCIKQEAEPSLEFPLTSVSVKTEDNVEKSFLLQQEPPEENREEPGCSLYLQSDKDKQTYSCSDTDDSDDWEPSAKRTTTCNRQESETVQKKDSKRAEQNTKYDGEGKPKPCKCSLCHRTFKCEANLQKHILNHSRLTSFTCAICNKAFRLKSSYSKHMITHREVKPFSCSFCNRGFTQKCHLKQHVRIHTGERPYSCSECSLTFRQQNSMLRHILAVHKREKPYRCPVCERAFVQKHNFFEHMRIHTGEKPYSCSVCNKGFTVKSYLKKHLRCVHQINEVAQNEAQE